MGCRKQACAEREAGTGGRRLGVFIATLVVGALAIGVMAPAALALSPTVATQPASAVGETGATLNGLVNPNGSETKYFFEYGTTTSYGSKTSETSAGSGNSTLEVGHPISGLKANTEYHYRIVASNSFGSSQGIDKTFTTPAPPEALTWVATPHGSGEGATLKAFVDPNGQSTSYYFEYGTSPGSYTKSTSPESAGSGSTSSLVSTTVTGLTPVTKYYYRVVATNAGGKSTSYELYFWSSKQPHISYLAPEVLAKKATLRADINTHGLPAKYYFEYGLKSSYGTKIPVTAKQINESEEAEVVPVSEVVSGLTPSTLYHYRLVAENSNGTNFGKDQTFTTQALVSLKDKGKGEVLKSGAPLKSFSSNLTFTSSSGSKHSCEETEFSGEVSENPGALTTVTGAKMQNKGGGKCFYRTGSGFTFTASYSISTEGLTMLYTTNPAAEGIVEGGEFSFVATIFLGNIEYGKCEYDAVLNGTYKTGVLEPTLSGEAELVGSSGSPPCFSSETFSGNFAVTTGGSTVEAV